MKYGIGITVHNRNETAKYVIEQWRLHLPNDCKFVVVDDASEIPFEGSTFRFDKNAGIAVSKNKCLELLDDCDHIWLSDDDVYPVNKFWYGHYTISYLNHVCYTFGRQRIKGKYDFYNSFIVPCGLLLYFKKICLDTVGGFDPKFGLWGCEHVSLSDRIYNAGLTPDRYIDIPESGELFYSLDEHNEVESSVGYDIRAAHIPVNQALQKESYYSKEFIPYK